MRVRVHPLCPVMLLCALFLGEGLRMTVLLVSVTLAEHTSVTTGALRRRNWTDFTRSLGHAISDWKQSPAFDGIVLGPFSQIETLYQEK